MREPKYKTGQKVAFVQFDDEKKMFIHSDGIVTDYRLGYQYFSYDIRGVNGKDYLTVPECAIFA